MCSFIFRVYISWFYSSGEIRGQVRPNLSPTIHPSPFTPFLDFSHSEPSDSGAGSEVRDLVPGINLIHAWPPCRQLQTTGDTKTRIGTRGPALPFLYRRRWNFFSF